MAGKMMRGIVCLLIAGALLLAGCQSPSTGSQANTANVPKPSNPGGTGPAVNLTGNAQDGAQVFKDNCVPCHGDQGKGGVDNPGSTRGTVPSLNPIDPALANSDNAIFARNIDLFIEHGSKPAGDNPTRQMLSFGDQKMLTPQQIADVIAYIISLNNK